ncbi:hypothetical protein AGDE_06735 [Angomonas deanei]|nr:hypothetical protein AGDE_06735 [Angomonas deanei]|eukprot:EPY36802.1 hypothetical protein AGDE_06735 [Angomonas deanei]
MLKSSVRLLVDTCQRDKLCQLFDTLGVKQELRKAPPALLSAFDPVLTPHFNFYDQQLTFLGDTAVQNYVTREITNFCVRTNKHFTVNGSKQLCSIFQNHCSLRLFAKRLGFDELATPISTISDTDLSFLESEHRGLRRADVQGTSFEVSALASAQSPLGWKLSHFIGATWQVCGPKTVEDLLESLFQLGSGNPTAAALKLLSDMAEHFSPECVAEALLAEQGLPLRFTCKSVIVPPDVSPDETVSSTGDDREACAREVVQFRGFGKSVGDTVGSVGQTSIAHGPAALDNVAAWIRRTKNLINASVEPAPQETLEDGWLTTEEASKYREGTVFGSVAASATMLSADAYGLSQPIDGQVIRRRKFKGVVRDPLFYDKRSDLRNGVPFQTGGVPLGAFLDGINKTHTRLFEVSMLAGGGEGKVIGKASAFRYSLARKAACRAYISLLARDLASI